jgi:chromosome segregation protein
MHLRSISMKGFKSFPQRTKLEFGTGVSVIVGPNGSGKSNITDAVLWALGEQSPLAVRGQSMKDVIFAGAHGVHGSNAAEVEVVIDNHDGALDLDFSEISIVRKLDRDGEGEYRLNGARCRLVDVVEVLSDSGLGKEMHSVVSQGKVEQIVLSRPRDRRLMIEEAAGLGKHRKRRRRAQLKLERTEENLSRALDVEREARSRLRPLKRQAEAAELHERLERQTLEARFALARDAARGARIALAEAEERARVARSERDEAERLLGEVARRREEAEEAFAAQTRDRERLQGRLYAARSASERIAMRLERVREQALAAQERRERRLRQIGVLEQQAAADAQLTAEERAHGDAPEGERGSPDAPEGGRGGTDAPASPHGGAAGRGTPQERIAAIEQELAALDAGREERLVRELEGLESELGAARGRVAELEAAAEARQTALTEADRAAEEARATRREAERAAEAARTRAAEVGAELAAVNQFVRGAGGSAAAARASGFGADSARASGSGADSARADAAPGDARTLAERLHVEPGFELALAAVLGPRLTAAVVSDRVEGERILDATGQNGGSVLVEAWISSPIQHGSGADPVPASPSVPTGQQLAQLMRPEREVAALADRLLAGVWVVDEIGALPETFSGVAVTRTGRLFDARTGELSQAPAGGAERLLEELARRDELVTSSEQAVRDEATARAAVDRHATAVAEADTAREQAESALRTALRAAAEAAEGVSRSEWLIQRRREAPQDGPEAVRRAELLGDLRAEQRLAERIEREREERARALSALRTGAERDAELAADADRAATALELARDAVSARRDTLEGELEAGAAAGEETAASLKSCAHEEAELQGRLKRASEAVTGAEVSAQQVRDSAADTERDLNELAGKLGLEPQPAAEPLPDEEREGLTQRVERLLRRREQLGPVNPLAKKEYDEAVAHVEELETQRADMESALAELEGLIKETDRRIREAFEQTFDAAAKNFEDVVQHLFPGGRGALRLVHEEVGPRPVVGGEPLPDGEAPEPAGDDEDEQPEAGVEIEVTPPGKSTKRLSLLSGGEKSLVALAFMFAVFLARPCPFYILDEVEAALDDLNIDRFLQLVKRYSDRAQFIVVTHQKRTMDAADTLYGVSMGGDGISRVVSRKLAGRPAEDHALSSAEEAAA